MTFWIYIHVRKRNEKWILRLCNFLIEKNARKISTFLYYRTSERERERGSSRTWHWALSFCELFFLPNLQLKKYLKTAIIIDESMIHVIVSRNCSIKPSYIFQLKRELKVWKYIFNLFHFEVLIQNRNPKFRSLSLFVLTFHEYKTRFVFGFRLDYKLSLFIFFCSVSSCFVCYLYVIINI